MKRSRDRASPSPEGLAAADAAASASTSAGHTSRSSTLADPGSEEGAAAAVVASATRSARTSSATLSVPIHMRVFQKKREGICIFRASVPETICDFYSNNPNNPIKSG